MRFQKHDFNGILKPRRLLCLRLLELAESCGGFCYYFWPVFSKRTFFHRKIQDFHGGFWTIFHSRLKRRLAVSKLQVQHWYPPWNWNQVCLPNFFATSKEPGAWQPLLLKSPPRQAGLKPHKLIGQEITHSKARKQAEIYTSKKRMAPRNSLQVWTEGD